jgi:hypothetical protein
MKKLCKILDKRTSEDPHFAVRGTQLATLAIMARNIQIEIALVSPCDVSPKNVSRCELT